MIQKWKHMYTQKLVQEYSQKHRSHNHQKVALIQISTSRRVDEQNVILPFSGILLTNKKEQTTDTCSKWINLRSILSKRSHIQNLHFVWFHLHEVSQKGEAIETKSRPVVAWGRGGEQRWAQRGHKGTSGVTTVFSNTGLWWQLQNSVNSLEII